MCQIYRVENQLNAIAVENTTLGILEKLIETSCLTADSEKCGSVDSQPLNQELRIRRTLAFLITGVGGFMCQLNGLQTLESFLTTCKVSQDGITQDLSSTELTTIQGMLKEIYEWLQELSKQEIQGVMSLLNTMGKDFVQKISGESTVQNTLAAVQSLENSKKDALQNKLSSSKITLEESIKRVEVYDILNVEDTHRFVILAEDNQPYLVSNCLSINYGAGVKKVGQSLFPELSEYSATSKAKKLVDKYKKTFYSFFKTSSELVKKRADPLILKHWGHIGLESATTAGNFPIQGLSACVLHTLIIKLSNKASWKKGIYVFAPLHDQILAMVKDDINFETNVNYIINSMKESVAEILNYEGKSIRVGYTVCESDEVFWEKDVDTVRRVHGLLNRDCNLTPGVEIVV